MAEGNGGVVRLSVKVEDAFRREVKADAARRGLTLQEYVRDALAAKMGRENAASGSPSDGGGRA